MLAVSLGRYPTHEAKVALQVHGIPYVAYFKE